MKCIIYISKVAKKKGEIRIPRGLSDVCRRSIRANRKHDVTGLLCYKRGYYLQALEGSESAVDQLYKNISFDVRHTQVIKVLDLPVESRSFPEWSMRLIGTLDKCPEFKQFAQRHAESLAGISGPDGDLFRKFYDMSPNIKGKTASGFQGKSLMLVAWPDFDLIRQSAQMIELCARMTFTSVDYRELVADAKLGTPSSIDVALSKFDSLGILRIDQSPNASLAEPATAANQNTSHTSDNFFNKMKRFLGLN